MDNNWLICHSKANKDSNNILSVKLHLGYDSEYSKVIQQRLLVLPQSELIYVIEAPSETISYMPLQNILFRLIYESLNPLYCGAGNILIRDQFLADIYHCDYFSDDKRLFIKHNYDESLIEIAQSVEQSDLQAIISADLKNIRDSIGPLVLM